MTTAWQREVSRALRALEPIASSGAAAAKVKAAHEARRILLELVDPRVEVVAQRLNGSSNPSDEDRDEAAKLLEYADAVDRREMISEATAARIIAQIADRVDSDVATGLSDGWLAFFGDSGVEVRPGA